MKLSKAQQEVVDKMREGWELKKDNAGYYLWHKTPSVKTIRDCTFHCLLRQEILKLVPGIPPPFATYQLTEKYRNNEG
jgi:hypothetical protein